MRRRLLLTLFALSAAPARAQGLLSSLTGGQAEAGLREALKVATKAAVGQVGRPDGFLKDAAVHIPLPGPLGTLKKTLGPLGSSGLFDELETKMNRAAEAAAPKAASIFGDAVASMSVTDAKGILAGPKDAATAYFRRTTSGKLTDAFRPIVDKALSQVGAAKALASIGALSNPLGGLLGGGGGGAKGFDLTSYATGKALDGLFHYVAAQEAQIRTNPAARTTDLLRSVFGG